MFRRREMYHTFSVWELPVLWRGNHGGPVPVMAGDRLFTTKETVLELSVLVVWRGVVQCNDNMGTMVDQNLVVCIRKP